MPVVMTLLNNAERAELRLKVTAILRTPAANSALDQAVNMEVDARVVLGLIQQIDDIAAMLNR